MKKFNTNDIPKSSRISLLIDDMYAGVPQIETDKAYLLTLCSRKIQREQS